MVAGGGADRLVSLTAGRSGLEPRNHTAGFFLLNPFLQGELPKCLSIGRGGAYAGCRTGLEFSLFSKWSFA